MIKFKYLTTYGLDFLRENIKQFAQEMDSHDKSDNTWISKFSEDKLFADSKYAYDSDFYLKITNGPREETDFVNATRIYELFKSANLNNTVIYEERFMAGFILTACYEYFMTYWGTDHLSSALFFESGARRSMARNAIGRLYRRVALSISPEDSDPYVLTKFGFDHPEVWRLEFYPSLDGRNVGIAYLRALKKWLESGKRLPNMQKLIKHMTLLANVNVIESMPEDDIEEYINDYLTSVLP